jgi:quercetin dioxygenase-like cupin family protein
MDANESPGLRAYQDGYRWDGVQHLPYKEEGSAAFHAISRQVLFSDPALACDLRYFEIEPSGYSSLERHEHVHAVMILRGSGQCLVGQRVMRVKPYDLVTVPSWTWHQFRADPENALGFLCMVNQARDRPQVPTTEELAALRANPDIAVFLTSGA